MPRTSKPPAYRRHKATGQAVVTLSGRDFYMGRHGSKTSRQAYDRLVGEWLANGRRLPADTADNPAITITELLAAYLQHARAYYRKGGRPTKEVSHVKNAIRIVKELYGRTPVHDFGPLKLKAVRQRLIDSGHNRTYVNDIVGRIKRMFKWSLENELVGCGNIAPHATI